jgi:hypothetical protein
LDHLAGVVEKKSFFGCWRFGQSPGLASPKIASPSFLILLVSLVRVLTSGLHLDLEHWA